MFRLSLSHAAGGRRILPLFVVFGFVVMAGPARAQTGLPDALKALAQDVKKLLDGRHETAITVGQFVGPVDLPTSSGPLIAKTLSEELSRLGVDVKVRGANLIVRGEYKLVPGVNSGPPAVALNVKIVDRSGEELVGLKLKPQAVYDQTAIAVLMGSSVDLLPHGGQDEAERNLLDSVEKPKTNLRDARVNASGKQPYAIEVLVKSGDKFAPRAAVDKDGLAFVELKPDEVYRVKVINDADFEATASLTIDGLNMFQFSEVKNAKTGQPLYDRLLVKPHGSFIIPGWHRNNDKNGSNEFQITRYADSEAAKLYTSSANVGTLTVTFAAAWPKGGKRPPDEPMRFATVSPDEVGTKRGAATGEGYKEVEREFGVTRAVISVRYSK